MTVSLENKPGALARVARLLAHEGVNIEAVEAEVLGNHGFFRFYTKELSKAEQALRASGLIAHQSDLVEVVVSNRPGELARMCETLAGSGINIESCFGSAWGTADQCRVFLRMDEASKGHQVLSKAGFEAYRTAH